jgi:hypothetical protein
MNEINKSHLHEELIYFIRQNILGRAKGKEGRNKQEGGKDNLTRPGQLFTDETLSQFLNSDPDLGIVSIVFTASASFPVFYFFQENKHYPPLLFFKPEKTMK